MSHAEVTPVSVSRRIQAPPEQLFAILADPAMHPGLDGSGMVREAISSRPVSAVGDVFTMKMHNDEMGDYEMTNHVVEYEVNRRIAWEPVLSAASRPEDIEAIGDPALHIWAFELTPTGSDATVVTETFDCSRSPEWLRNALDNGNRWVATMETTLERLDERMTP